MSSLRSDCIHRVVLAYGTTRVLRVVQVGDAYHMENLQTRDGAERWLPVVRSDGPDGRAEIFDALREANIGVKLMMKEAARDRRIHEARGGSSPGE